MTYFIGIDAGGSRTRVIVVNCEGTPILRTEYAGLNYYHLGCDAALTRFERIARDLYTQIDGFEYCLATCIGIAGVIESAIPMKLQSDLSRLFPGSVEIHNDAWLAWYAVASGEPAIALIAGTGSVAFGIDEAQRVCSVGGLGYLYDDQGSGFDIGRRGIKAAIALARGDGQETALLDALKRHYELGDYTHLPLYVESPAKVATFAERVHDLAQEGDLVALDLIGQSAEELVHLVIGVRKQGDFHVDVPVGLMGGCLAGMSLLRSRVELKLAEHGLISRMTEHSPVEAAGIAALRCGSAW